jgi:NADH-ubiquinone oxidoreductase chain 5
VTYKVIDRGLIEEVGPTGIVKVLSKLSKGASEIQSGQIYHYSLTIIIGTIAYIIYNSL